jgi:hypothetical protein
MNARTSNGRDGVLLAAADNGVNKGRNTPNRTGEPLIIEWLLWVMSAVFASLVYLGLRKDCGSAFR